MLTIFSKPHRTGGFCDGVNRRDFLTIGGSILGGLALPQLLRAEAQQGRGTQHKAIINVYLPGGPPRLMAVRSWLRCAAWTTRLSAPRTSGWPAAVRALACAAVAAGDAVLAPPGVRMMFDSPKGSGGGK